MRASTLTAKGATQHGGLGGEGARTERRVRWHVRAISCHSHAAAEMLGKQQQREVPHGVFMVVDDHTGLWWASASIMGADAGWCVTRLIA